MEAEDYGQQEGKQPKKQNTLPLWGSERTMNLNNMILTNVLQSPYFKNQLYQLKTYHEVVDEIYYKVDHLEPWEKGSRKTSGQVGMCGGVRGVGAGGIASTAYCLLYKLFTLRLTRKQLNGLLSHTDSPYIRALGFMYIRYCQPPVDMWDWYEPHLEDEEDFEIFKAAPGNQKVRYKSLKEVDPKAGTGCTMTIGQMARSFMLKLEWYGTLFPRIPVPIQKELEKKLSELNLCDDHKRTAADGWETENYDKRDRNSPSRKSDEDDRRKDSVDRSRRSGDRDSWSRISTSRRSRSRDRSSRITSGDRDRDRRDPDRERQRDRDRDREGERRRSKDRERKQSKERRSRSRDRRRSRSRDRQRSDRDKDQTRRKSKSPAKHRSKDKSRREQGGSRDKREDSRGQRRGRSKSR